jgi:DNA-binding response OmpR family regulator
MKILLVDDEEKFVVMLSKRLVMRGMVVDYAFTGEEALAKNRSSQYDVAILDVKMPGIGGIELERKLKNHNPGLKTIFLTGHGSENDFKTGASEAVHYLAKPLKIESLVSILNEIAG